MTDFKTAFEKIKSYVTDFEADFTSFTSPQYSEAAVRQDFIDKFFHTLGWDVYHDYQKNLLHREVRIENPQRQQHSISQKRADYAFFLKPDFKNPKFFVEAKKPASNLKSPDYYFQTMRYGWNAGTGIAVLTDFEEFHIIDCRNEPDINRVFDGQHKRIHYLDYRKEELFAEIYWLFSREAVEAGNIERYIEELPKPKGSIKQATLFGGRYRSIDDSFLEYIDSVRLRLARAFKGNDPSLTSEMLTESTQRTVDRLVFIRFLEDKLIEPNNIVSEFGSHGSSWRDFVAACRRLDAKYNGVVFKKHNIDEFHLNESADLDFRQICQNISHLNTPYDFNYIPVHILGSIYERFLGQIVVLKGRSVTIEPKLSVRRAGGVYYTPKHVVDYIVQKTVFSQLQGKTPKEITKFRFADIACGSGSFLIGVFECLLDYHIEYYNSHPEDAKKDNCPKVDGGYTLSIKQKQKILLNNIYGVDIDHQAVEVTQLSLYLTMMEDETTATANEMMVLFHEKILPDLSQNIQSGNSLIGTDILNNSLFEFDEERMINPFDYERAYPHIFARGGFDAIVGNPPYDVLEKDRLGEKSPHSVLHQYIRQNKKYEGSLGGKLNLYRFFIVKGLQLLKENGKFGLIVPLSLIADVSCANTRSFLLSNSKQLELSCFPQKDNPSKRIFKDAKLSTAIFISTKSAKARIDQLSFSIETYPNNSFEDLHKTCQIEAKKLKLIDKSNLPIPLIGQDEYELLIKLHSGKNCINISELPKEVIVRRGEINQTIFKKYITDLSENCERLIKGVQIGPFKFNTKLSQGKVEWFNEIKFLKENEERTIATFRRIATQRITGVDERLRLVATIIEPKAYFADSTNSIHVSEKTKYSLEYILGLLNSKLFQWRFKLTSTNNNVGTNEIESLPFRKIDFANNEEENYHKNLSNWVAQILQAKEKLSTVYSQRDRDYIQRKIDTFENQINELVYKLYNLSSADILLVEESFQKTRIEVAA